MVILPGFSRASAARSLRRANRRRGVHHQHGRVEGDAGDADEVAQRVVRRRLEMRIDGGDAGGGEIERVAVRRALGDELGADRAVGAGAVLHHDRLAERRAQLVGEEPRHEVGGAARREADHQLDRAGGVVLRGGRRIRCSDAEARECKSRTFAASVSLTFLKSHLTRRIGSCALSPACGGEPERGSRLLGARGFPLPALPRKRARGGHGAGASNSCLGRDHVRHLRLALQLKPPHLASAARGPHW